MLAGGVVTSVVALPSFATYQGTPPVYDSDSLAGELHALFCYAWYDKPGQLGDGWWECKNRWVASVLQLHAHLGKNASYGYQIWSRDPCLTSNNCSRTYSVLSCLQPDNKPAYGKQQGLHAALYF
jgi:hypothetical protein